ncbi:MAG: hypothetical protein ACOX3K_01145 [Bacilli bacterium]|jgi:hypothetical protein
MISDCKIDREVTPEECIIVYRRGVQEGLDIIIEKFEFLIKKEANDLIEQYPYTGLEREDFHGVGVIALIQAVNSFEFGKSVFAGYARLLIQRAMRAYMKECSTKNFSVLNYAMSLEQELFEDGKITLGDTVGSYDPHLAYNTIPEDDLENLINYIEIDFTEEEAMLALYRLRGYTYDEIIVMTKWSRKKVFAIAKTLKNKLSDYTKQ